MGNGVTKPARYLMVFSPADAFRINSMGNLKIFKECVLDFINQPFEKTGETQNSWQTNANDFVTNCRSINSPDVSTEYVW